MSLKAKLMVGTLAAGMVMSSLAGIPLSDKGLNEKLGLGVASAADLDPIAQLVAEQVNVYHALESNNGLAAVEALQDAVNDLHRADHVALLGGLYTKLQPVLADLDSTEKDAVIDLLRNLATSPFAISLDVLDNPSISSAIAKLKTMLGVSSITKSDIASFLLELNDQAYDVISADANWQSNKEADLHLIWDNTLAANPTGGELFGAVISTYYAGNSVDFVNDIVTAYGSYRTALGAEVVDPALNALVSAFLTVNQPVVVPPSGGGSLPPESSPVGDVLNNLGDLKKQLDNATPAEKQALVEKAVQQVNTALASSAKLDLSKSVSVDGNKAAVSVAADTVSKLIDNVSKLKAALLDTVGSADGLVIPPVTFDLGDLGQSTVTSALSNDVLAQLAGAGFEQFSLSYNGLNFTFPTSGDFAKGIEFTSAESAATGEETHGLKAASSVYSFSLKVGDTDTEKFSKPILIKFPYDASDVDPELLSVARIEEDGTLSFQGGDLEGGFIVEPRYSLSSYLVVENKVAFTDIASVQSWAGRQIEVIAAKGAIQGKSEGIFAPKDNITRAEFAKILVTALNLDNANASSDKFSDVKSDDWFAPYVAVAVEKGIINGRTATTFDPNATITRAELSTMIARALQSVKGVKAVADADTALAAFSDAGTISSSLKAGVALAASKNIVIGDGGKFRPNDKANRAEAAVIIYRAINVKA